MKLLAVSALLAAISVGASAATVYVPDNSATIQGAIDAATNGDTIIVRAGTYKEIIDFRGKAIALRSEAGPELTTIDGNQLGSVVKFIDGEGPDSIIEGFTITNGVGTLRPAWQQRFGGGIRCHKSSPSIRNNIITKNSVNGGLGANQGGGIYCWGSSPNIDGNLFTQNLGFEGGGISCTRGKPMIRNNLFYNNEAYYGGGIQVAEGGGAILSNVFSSNVANYSGGAIACQGGTPRIGNNIIERNRALCGGGVYFDLNGAPEIANNTIVNNEAWDPYLGGGGILSSSNILTIRNTILYGNHATKGKEIYVSKYINPSIVEIDYCDVEGGAASVHVASGCTVNWGAGIIDADPLCVDLAAGDCHLTWNSPCRNVGVNGSSLPATDHEGDPRVVQGQVDIGADEFYFHLYHAGDVSPGGAMDLRIVGGPGMPVLLGHSLGIQDPPQSTTWGDLFLTVPPRWSSKIGTIPANGVLSFPITVPGFWSPGDEKYFQALVGAPGGAYATLTNLETLEVE